jgi:DNA-directed RNA polymerase specialized sigma24 family protein
VETNALEFFEYWKWVVSYELCCALHESRDFANDIHSQKLLLLVNTARGEMETHRSVIWPGLSEDDVLTACKTVKEKVSPFADDLRISVKNLNFMVQYPEIDDFVRLIDNKQDGEPLSSLEQAVEVLSTDAKRLKQIKIVLRNRYEGNRRSRVLTETIVTDLRKPESDLIWALKRVIALKRVFEFTRLLYSLYSIGNYYLFLWKLDQLLRLVQESGKTLRQVVEQDNVPAGDWWQKEFRPILLAPLTDDISHLLKPESEAIAEFLEARYKLGVGDMEKAIGILWDQGAPRTRSNVGWDQVKTLLNSISPRQETPDEVVRICDRVVQLINTLDDYCKHNHLDDILKIAGQGNLGTVLRTATWHDYLDEIKAEKAKKRGERKVIPFAEMPNSFGNIDNELIDEKVSYAAGIASDPFKSIDAKIELDHLAKSTKLSGREREALELTIALTKSNGEMPNYKDVGKRMGVAPGTAKTFLDRACQKMKKEYMKN